jgi:tetratricopeptide (TPR) repeat protein
MYKAMPAEEKAANDNKFFDGEKMKAEHRHELKTNELAEWIVNFPTWAKENFKPIIYVAVVAVIVIGAIMYQRYQKNVVAVRNQVALTGIMIPMNKKKVQILQAQQNDMDVSYTLIQSADNLQTIADNAKNDQQQSFALLQKAAILRTELNYRLGTVRDADKKKQLAKVKAAYNKVLAKSADDLSITAAAHLGLGLCEEELGNFQAAEQIYKKLVENPDLSYTVAATQAGFRLGNLSDYKNAVVFKKPVEQILDQPQSDEVEFDFNIPTQFGSPNGL